MSFRFNQGDRPLPGYTIQRGVGRGGFGEVYYAVSDGGKEVALKYLRENPQVELRGATHCLNLKSPYLIALHDIKQNTAGEFFVIMEFVNGLSLRDLMNEEPHGLGRQKAAYFTREIAKGLTYLHDRGIVHRDLKPGNIFYEDGYVKIGDYGLSKIMAASQHSGQTVSVGTVHYMAPEVGSGNYDRTIDIYALGVVLYEMLLGRVPFSGSSMGEVLMKHLTAQPEVDELPEPFPRVIRKALAKDPADRYQTVNEMVADLFEVEDLNRSVAAFEPASLSTLAARASKKAVGISTETLAAGGVALGAGSSNVGQMIPPPILQPNDMTGDRRFGRMRGRLAAGMQKVHDRVDQTTAGGKIAGWVGESESRKEAVGKTLAACVAASAAVTILMHREPAFGAAVFLHCASILAALCLWHRWTGSRSAPRMKDDWGSGLVFAVIAGGLFFLTNRWMVEADLLSRGAENWVYPAFAAFLLCDWRQRFRDGRYGLVSAGSAFAAGLFGFIASKIMMNDSSSIPVIGILAGSSLGAQALGGFWPLSPPAKGGSTRKPGSTSSATGESSPVGFSSDEPDADVAISRDRSPGSRLMPPPVPSRASTTQPPPPLRHNGVRAIWFGLTGLSALAMVLCFVALGTMHLSSQDHIATLIAGVVLSHMVFFALSCAVPRFHKGLWRGLFRKAIFFAGTATVAGCGTAIGAFGLDGDELFGAIAAILVGALTAIFVWIIPVSAPGFLAASRAPKVWDEVARLKSYKARRIVLAGLALWGLALVLIPVLLITVHERDWDEAFPATMVPLGLIGFSLIITGAVKSRQVAAPRESAMFEMPLRRVCRVESTTIMRRSLEHHAFLQGYRLDSERELLWRFVRGIWTAQFWQPDIRKWKTQLVVAAYDDGQGGYRVTCQLDVDSQFRTPDSVMVERLSREMDELKALLETGEPAGREFAA